MLFRLLVAFAMTKTGQNILIDMYKRYFAANTRKDYRR